MGNMSKRQQPDQRVENIRRHAYVIRQLLQFF